MPNNAWCGLATARAQFSKGLFADWAKVYGPVLVFKSLWQKTGLKRIISDYAKERKFEFDVSSVIFSMVLGRLLDLLSKLSTQKWLKERYMMKT